MPDRVKITGDLYHRQVPDGAVAVTRPSRWGNPHKVGPCPVCGTRHDNAAAVAAYADDLIGGRLRITTTDVREHLAGADLACWCAPDQPCHADVLLTVANTEGDRP